jgi:hypothetical protein
MYIGARSQLACRVNHRVFCVDYKEQENQYDDLQHGCMCSRFAATFQEECCIRLNICVVVAPPLVTVF